MAGTRGIVKTIAVIVVFTIVRNKLSIATKYAPMHVNRFHFVFAIASAAAMAVKLWIDQSVSKRRLHFLEWKKQRGLK
jgi:hypothetical protein